MSIRKGIWVTIVALVLVSIACSVPVLDNIFKSETTPTNVSETATVISAALTTPLPPIPPTLVEVDPALGVELNPNEPITLYFDQPMDTDSVAAALHMDPILSADLTWLDNSTLQYTPLEPMALASRYNLSIEKEAKSFSGLSLKSDIQLPFNSAGYLEVTQVNPLADAVDVNPTSAITIVFNRPVVSLEIDGDQVDPR
jgi:hypothetical protein